MAAPVNPINSQLSVGFYQMAVDMITILSNLSIPTVDTSQTGVISGTTASIIITALQLQQSFY